MKITVLGSGSTGNAVLIVAGDTRVLVDAGLSAKEIARRLALVGEDVQRLDAVLVTHEHGDHAGGLRVLLAHCRLSSLYLGANLRRLRKRAFQRQQ